MFEDPTRGTALSKGLSWSPANRTDRKTGSRTVCGGAIRTTPRWHARGFQVDHRELGEDLVRHEHRLPGDGGQADAPDSSLSAPTTWISVPWRESLVGCAKVSS